MKLLFLLTYYYPHWTGLTQYATLLAEGLALNRNDIEVLTTQHDKKLARKEVRNGVTVERAVPLFSISRTIVSLDLILKLYFHIRRVDRVVIFLPFQEVLIATLIARLFGKKVIFIHNGDLHLPAGFLNRILEWIFFQLTDISMRIGTSIIVNTQDYAKNSPLLMRHQSKWKEVYPPIDHIPPQKEFMNVIKKKLSKKGPYIGFAGRFVEEKGFDILLRAIPLVRKKYPSAQFLYAGKPVDYEDFFEQCSELIHAAGDALVFLGKIEREQMGSFYDSCDIFVIPSRSDFFPFVQIEALLAGKPVVVTDIPGARVPVTKTGFGVVVPVNDPSGLAKGICECLTEHRLLQKSKIKVTDTYSAKHSLQKHMEIFYE